MKELYIKVILLWFCVTNYAYAQNSLSGVVLNKQTRELLPGATVYIPDLKTGTVSDRNGQFKIEHLPKGKFLVEVKYISYATLVMTADINGAVVLNIELEPSITELKGVVVTGVSSATDNSTNPVPVLSIDQKLLAEQTGTNLIDAIARQPGVAAISTGQAIAKPNIRGLGYNRVVTLYNGMRQEGQQWGDEHGIELDEYSVDRVEIIKGPGSILYGSDALAGVLNFLTPAHVAQGKIIGSLQSNYQTNGNFFGYSAMNAGSIRGFSWQARFSQKYAGNYRNRYDGLVYNSGFNETDYNGHIALNRKWGYSRLYFSSFHQQVAMTEGERDSLGNFVRMLSEDSLVTVTKQELNGYVVGVPYQQIQHQRILWVNQFFIGRSRLAVSGGYQLNQRKEFGDPSDKSRYSLYFYLPAITYDVKYFFPDKNKWKSSAGFSGMWQRNQNKGDEFLIPAYRMNDVGLFIFTQRSIRSRLNVSAGIRYDIRSVRGEQLMLDSSGQVVPIGLVKFGSFHKIFSNVAASTGLTYAANEKTLFRFNIARGFRAPNIAELASNGRHEGTYRYEYGNTDLKAETSLQADMGVEWNSEHVHLSVSAFGNRIANYIYAVRLQAQGGGDSIADLNDPVPTYQYGQGKALLYGGELTLDVHPHPLDWLHLENSFSWVQAQQFNQPDSSRYLPFIPAPRLLSEVRLNTKKAGNFLRNAFIRFNLEHYFAQNRFLKENNTERGTPAYVLFNMGVGTEVVTTKGVKRFTLLVSANNLFDVAYQNHLSRLKYAGENSATGRLGVYNMGRTISVKLMVPVQFR